MAVRTVRTSVDIPISTYRKLEKHAAAQGRVIEEVILVSIKSYLRVDKPTRVKKVRFPLIRSKGPKIDLTNTQIYERVIFP